MQKRGAAPRLHTNIPQAVNDTWTIAQDHEDRLLKIEALLDSNTTLSQLSDAIQANKLPTMKLPLFFNSKTHTLEFRIDANPSYSTIILTGLKSGVDQASAGALINEVWRDTVDNSLRIGV